MDEDVPHHRPRHRYLLQKSEWETRVVWAHSMQGELTSTQTHKSYKGVKGRSHTAEERTSTHTDPGPLNVHSHIYGPLSLSLCNTVLKIPGN